MAIALLSAVAFFFIIFIMMSTIASGDYGTWTDDRYDLYNTGNVIGTSFLTDPNEMYWLNVSGDLISSPIVLDVDRDGYNELIYATLQGEVFVRDANTGGLIKNLTLEWEIINPPMAFQSDLDDEYRLIVVTRSFFSSRIHVVDLTDYSIVKTLTFNENISYAGRIVDIDRDGFKELIFGTFEGYFYSYDLYTYRTEWRTFVHRGLTLPPAIFNRDGQTYIAISVGVTMIDFYTTVGSTHVYGLRGTDGELTWSFDTGKFISTPPVVIMRNGSTPECLVAFGTVSNTLYLVDFDSNRTYLDLKRSDFKVTSWFRYLSYVHDNGTGKDLLVMLAQRSCSVLDIVDKEILWIEYFQYPNDRIDTLCVNVALDPEQELVILDFDRVGKVSRITIKYILDGVNQSHIEDLPTDPYDVLFADFNNDDFLELAIRSKRSIVVFGNRNDVQIREGRLGGSTISNASQIVLYSMYRPYDLRFHIMMTTTLSFVDYLDFFIDPDDQNIKLRYYPSTSKVEFISTHIIIENIDMTFDSGSFVFSLDIYLNWTFPHENWFGLVLYIRLIDTMESSFSLVDVFRVENDVVFQGDRVLRSDGSEVPADQWFLPRDEIEFSGLFLSYEGDATKVPSPEFFTLYAWSGSMTWPVDLGEDCQISISLGLNSFTTGSYEIVIEFLSRPSTANVDDYSFTLRVDSDPVDIIDVYPNDINWIVGGDVWIGVIATDGNGSGINQSTVRLKYALDSEFESSNVWFPFDNIYDGGDGLWEFLVRWEVSEGEYRFQWRITDIAGHEHTYSDVHSLTIDDSLIRFEDQYPNDWANTTSVETGISIVLNVSYQGMKVQYAVGSDPFLLNEWMGLDDVLDLYGTISVSVILELEEGIDNYIQWRVVINETVNVKSGHYQILVDTMSPHFGEPTPDLNQTFDGDSVSITIPVMDEGSGVDATTLGYQISSSPDFSDSVWYTMESSTIDGILMGSLSLSGLTGKDNYIRFRARDNVRNPFGISGTYRIGFNEPPILISFSPENNTRLRKGDTVHFSATVRDPDPLDEHTIEWFSDQDGHLGWGPYLNVSNLSVGTHQVTIRYSDDHGNSREDILTIHIDPVPESPDDNKLTIVDNWNLILLIVIIASVLLAVLILRSRLIEE
jgi:hypothetical protein